MNKINPLYILVFLIVVMIISFDVLNDAKQSLVKSSSKLNYFEKDALEYNRLKSKLTTKKETLKQLNQIINNQEFSKIEISSTIQKSTAIVKMVTSDKRIMQIFLNKVLNKSIKINKMEATKKYLIVEVAF